MLSAAKHLFRLQRIHRVCPGDVKAVEGDNGNDTRIIVPEDEDIPLQERYRRINDICRREGTANVILISIHVNAADYTFLLSDEGHQAIVDLHVDGIRKYLQWWQDHRHD